MGKFGKFFESFRRKKEEKEDLGLAEEELLLIFKDTLKRTERLIFLKSFLKRYNRYKGTLISLNEKFKSAPQDSDDKERSEKLITEITSQLMYDAYALLDKCKGEKKEITREIIADNIGNALASFIVAIEYGFASDGFRKKNCDNS